MNDVDKKLKALLTHIEASNELVDVLSIKVDVLVSILNKSIPNFERCYSLALYEQLREFQEAHGIDNPKHCDVV